MDTHKIHTPNNVLQNTKFLIYFYCVKIVRYCQQQLILYAYKKNQLKMKYDVREKIQKEEVNKKLFLIYKVKFEN